MCGAAGFVVANRDWPVARLRSAAQAMACTLAHRGPDDSGVWTDEAAGVALGHRRLSIVDTSWRGHQPMVSTDGRWVLVYNGELYNGGDLRVELTAAGERFKGHSDTEVLLSAVSRWGVRRALEATNGMFALGAWDRRERVLWLGRDRLGEKPLYYGWQDGVFLFGSELKALRANPAFRADIDRGALDTYLRRGYVPTPLTIYEGISKLPPGCALRIDPSRPTAPATPTCYWSVSDSAGGDCGATGATGATADQSVPLDRELEALLADAVRRRMVADVPLGALLSGGVDSSTVVALMQAASPDPVRTFTIGFHEAGFDEAPHAAAIARHLGCDHTELYVTPAEARDVIPHLPEMYDEPFADSSQIPTYLVCALAHRSVTVALSGDGGDEAFGGYNRYVWGERISGRAARLPASARAGAARALGLLTPRQWSVAGRALARVSPLCPFAGARLGEQIAKARGVLTATSPGDAYAHLISAWEGPSLVVSHADGPASPVGWPPPTPVLGSFTEQMMYADTVGYLLDDILVKVDRASMATSLEVRVPFLDHRVIEAAWRLPLKHKVAGGMGKIPLRRILDRHVPRDLVERPKTGFAVPLGAWLRGPLRSWAETLLDERRLQSDGYLRPGPVRRVWAEHLAGQGQREPEIWAVLMFQSWLDRWQNPGPGTQRTADGWLGTDSGGLQEAIARQKGLP